MSISAALQLSQGGRQTFSFWSGGISGSIQQGLAGVGFVSGIGPVNVNSGYGHAVIWSGPGRLNEITYHQYLNLATPVTAPAVVPVFYDNNAVPVSGVPAIVNSGCTVLGVVQPPSQTSLSGGILLTPSQPTVEGIPFFNGLSVWAGLSGMVGCTVSYTPGVQN